MTSQSVSAFADEHGLRIAHVFLTHLHADFLAGHLELRIAHRRHDLPWRRGRGGVRVHSAGATAMRIEFGARPDQALETPGHTPESISLLVFDRDRSETHPYAVLTGDTLFVGDVGRPDLRAALGWSARDSAALLYDSLHKKLLPLPDASLVYPAHGAGSLCGKALGKETVSTIGEQRRVNYALQPMTQGAPSSSWSPPISRTRRPISPTTRC